MSNLTLRNIPEIVLDKIRILSEIERRSLNSEMLFIIEDGLSSQEKKRRRVIDKDTQISLWKEIAGSWIDDRSTGEIVGDIYTNRSQGRDIDL
jgi:plasmid stability protein